MRQLVTF